MNSVTDELNFPTQQRLRIEELNIEDGELRPINSPLLRLDEPRRRVRVLTAWDDQSAYVGDFITPAIAQLSSLFTVTELFDEEAIKHFVIRGGFDFGSSVGVHAEDRDRVHDVFKRRLSESPADVTQILPKPRVIRRGLTTAKEGFARVIEDAKVFGLWWNLVDAQQRYLLGRIHGVEIEFWEPGDWREGLHGRYGPDVTAVSKRMVGPRPNRAARSLESDSKPVRVEAATLLRSVADDHVPSFTVTTRQEFTPSFPEEVNFPIDLVYTWVDGTDSDWLAKKEQFTAQGTHAESTLDSRFLSRDELRYSLRSVEMFAPWVNHIYIVTDDQVPDWLSRDIEKVSIVDHREIFADPAVLPTFNSHAIEANLHRIEGLSEHFLYLNDDMFFGRPVLPNKFFAENGLARLFASRNRIPLDPPNVFDTPVDVATKNGRALIEKQFGVTISRVMEHAPYPLRRSVLEDMEAHFPEAFEATSAQRFRSTRDYNIASNLAHHYAFLSGKAVMSSVDFAYVGLTDPQLAKHLTRILERRDRDAFCINDTFSDVQDFAAQSVLLDSFFENYFPFPSSAEIR